MAKKAAPSSKKAKPKSTKPKSANSAKKNPPKQTAKKQAKGVSNTGKLDPKIIEKITQVRSQVRENFGTVVMSMMMLPRYRHLTLSDLQHLVLEPIIRDRIAIAYPVEPKEGQISDLTGTAIWASVSPEVDIKITDQIKSGIFPVRLTGEDWTSGDIHWLLDVIAPDKKTTTSVISNFKQVVKEGPLRMHPVVTRLLDPETLEKMGAQKMTKETLN